MLFRLTKTGAIKATIDLEDEYSRIENEIHIKPKSSKKE